MPTITLKNVPDDLHRRLTDRAQRHRRSLNQEVIRCLEDRLLSDEPKPVAFNREAFLVELRKSHEEMRTRGVWLTDDSIREAIDRERDQDVGMLP